MIAIGVLMFVLVFGAYLIASMAGPRDDHVSDHTRAAHFDDDDDSIV